MAITYPLSTAVFADQLRIESMRARLGHNQELSNAGSGIIYAADVAPALREFDITTEKLSNVENASIMGLIEALGGSINEFYLYDPRKRYPANDLTGAILGASNVQINSLNVNNKAISLKGLPAGYTITRGDMMHWDFSSTRRAYHRAVETIVANGSGVTAEFEIRDFIVGGAVNAVVTLVKAAMKCKMKPGSIDDGSTDPLNSRISFTVRQVI